MYQVDSFNNSYRRLVAKRNISKGEVVMSKAPLFYSVISHSRKNWCNNCLKQGDKLSKCSACNVPYYCGKQCQTQDWKIHKLECKAYKEIAQKNYKITSDFHILMRIYKSSNELSQFLSNLDKFSPEKLNFFTEQSYMILKSLEEEITPDKMEFLISSQAKLATNAITIQDSLFQTDGIAVGLYEEVNYMNHSCSPNVICVFDKLSEVKVVAIKDIQAGEEIMNSYVDTKKLLNERRQFLKENYFFTCECQRCLREQNEGVQFVRCKKCKQGRVNSKTLKCSKCTQDQSVMTDQEYQQIITQMQSIQKESTRADLEKINQLVTQAEALCYPEAPFFNEIYYSRIVAALGTEQYKQANKMLRKYIDISKYWYEDLIANTIELPFLGWKFNEVSKLNFHLDKCLKAEQYGEQAIRILSKYYTRDACSEFNESYFRLGEIKSEIKMKHS